MARKKSDACDECPCLKELMALTKAHDIYFKALRKKVGDRFRIAAILHGVHMTLGHIETQWLDEMRQCDVIDDLRDEAGTAWMVTIDGTSHGDYENCANSVLFGSYAKAKAFVEDDIEECILNDRLVNPRKHTKDELAEAIADHVQWYGNCVAQYRNDGTIMDWTIDKIAIPKKKGL